MVGRWDDGTVIWWDGGLVGRWEVEMGGMGGRLDGVTMGRDGMGWDDGTM